MPKIDMTNDGPSTKFQKKDQVKLVLDMSNNGPMFKMLEQMAGAGGKGGAANEALKKLLKSGIPGLEGLLAGGGGELSSQAHLQEKLGKKVCRTAAVTNVINALACVYCYFLRSKLTGWRSSREKSYSGELLTAAVPL